MASYWIDTLVLRTKGNTYATLLHHPFLFKGKPTQCSRGSNRLKLGIHIKSVLSEFPRYTWHVRWLPCKDVPVLTDELD